MNKPDLTGKIVLIPYLIALYYLDPLYSIILSLIYLVIITNLILISRSYFKADVKPLWIIPASYIIYLGLNLLLNNIFTPGLFFFILIFLLMTVYRGGYEDLSRYTWLYILVLASIFIITPFTGLRYYLFYLLTPVIDYIWIRCISSGESIDVILSSIILILVYLPVAFIISLFIVFIVIVKTPLYLRGLDTYMMFIDYYLRIFYGWLIGFGH